MPINFFDSAPAGQIPDFSQLGALGKIGLVLQNVADPTTVPRYQQSLQQQNQQNIINQTRQNELDKQSALAGLYADPNFLSLPLEQQLLRQAQVTGDGSALASYQVGRELTPFQQLSLQADRDKLALERQKIIAENSISTNPNITVGNPLISSVINAESAGNRYAVSPAGAQGLMQIMPDTARDPGYGVTPLQGWDGVNPMSAPPEEQVRFGTEYLNALTKANGGDTSLGLAAYNAGQGNVEKYNGVPPFEETQNYVNKVLTNAGISGSMSPVSAKPLYKGGKPYNDGLPSGYQWYQGADGQQVAQKIPGTGATKEELDQQSKAGGKQGLENTLLELQGLYDDLARVGEAPTSNQSPLANIADRYTNSPWGLGSVLADVYGTPGASIRQKIDAAKGRAAAQYIQAAGLTSGQTNAASEQERFLSTLGKASNTYEANQEIVESLSKAYGTGTVKARDYKDVIGTVNGFTVRKK